MAPQIDANLAASAPCGHDPTVLRARRSRQFGGVVTRVAGNFTKGASETAARRGTRSRVGRPPDAAARPLAGQQPVAKSPRCISSGDASRLRPASVAFGSDCRPATPTGSLHRSRRRLPAALFVGCICPICALLTPCQAGASAVSPAPSGRGCNAGFHHGLPGVCAVERRRLPEEARTPSRVVGRHAGPQATIGGPGVCAAENYSPHILGPDPSSTTTYRARSGPKPF